MVTFNYPPHVVFAFLSWFVLHKFITVFLNVNNGKLDNGKLLR